MRGIIFDESISLKDVSVELLCESHALFLMDHWHAPAVYLYVCCYSSGMILRRTDWVELLWYDLRSLEFLLSDQLLC